VGVEFRVDADIAPHQRLTQGVQPVHGIDREKTQAAGADRLLAVRALVQAGALLDPEPFGEAVPVPGQGLATLQAPAVMAQQDAVRQVVSGDAHLGVSMAG
jgi:hypothetical protein